MDIMDIMELFIEYFYLFDSFIRRMFIYRISQLLLNINKTICWN